MEHSLDNELLERVSAVLDEARGQMIELQRGLCALPALSPSSGGSGEMAKADWLMGRLAGWGFPESEYYPAPDDDVPEGERPNHLVRIPGASSDRTTWVLTHLDVVPPGEESLWSGDPWTLRIEDGKLYGRGVEDNQQGMVSSIFAAKALLDEGITPPFDVVLAFVADEETGSRFGAGYLMEHHRDLFRSEDLLLIPDAGDEAGEMIEVAEKSIAWFQFTVRGRQTHGSTPDHGVNAHKAGAHLIVLLEQLYEDFPARNDLFDPPVSTFEPTMKKANVENINTIPGEDVFAFDCRVMPDYTLEDVRAAIEGYAKEVELTFGVTVEIETPSWQPAAPATSPEAPIVGALNRAVKRIYGVDARPMGIGGGTVASFFRKAGIPAAVWSRMDDQAHMPDEYCVIDNMVGDAKVMVHLFLES